MKKPTTPHIKRKIKIILAFLLLATKSFAHFSAETPVLIVACKSGTLVIDGTTIGPIDANDATKQILSFGEHYLQLKTETEKYNLTITVDQDTKDIFRLGCVINNTSQAIRLIDKQLNLAGALSNDFEQNTIGLDKDDEIVINCSILNKKGNATIFIKEIYKGIEIYKKERFNNIASDKIKIPSKGIYHISLYTDALFGKDARLTVDRIPSPDSNPNFNTTVRTVHDTSSVEVLNTVSRVYSITNLDHPNKTAISINLPKNTAYWVYWIGVGQEAQQEMKRLASTLSKASSVIVSNPLVAFGLKLIPSLPMLNTTATINYRFTDTNNGRAFVNGQNYSYYKFKHADNVSTDYSMIKTYASDLVLSMDNQSTMAGRDVEIKVVAFVITSRLVLEEEKDQPH